MIFSIRDHPEMVKHGQKTQTRRKSGFYKVGRTYSIQYGRGLGIPDGRILIIDKRKEVVFDPKISKEDAWDEGCYRPDEFEDLYSQMYSGWQLRWAYTFKYVPSLGDTRQ